MEGADGWQSSANEKPIVPMEVEYIKRAEALYIQEERKRQSRAELGSDPVSVRKKRDVSICGIFNCSIQAKYSWLYVSTVTSKCIGEAVDHD